MRPVADLVAVELDEAERELTQQARGGVRFAVPRLVLRRREPEVGAEVDDVRGRGGDQVRDEALRLPVR